MRPVSLLVPALLAAACAAPRESPALVLRAPRAGLSSSERVEEPSEPERIASVEALGCPVEDADGERVGSVKDLRLDPGSGSVGGIEVHVPDDGDVELRWSEAGWVRREGGLVLALEPEGLRALQHGAAGEAARASALREPETLVGQVDSKRVVTTAEGVDELRLTLRGKNNHFHRVSLGPLQGREVLPVPLEPGQPLELRGFFTHDAEGKLFLAESLTAGDRTVEIPAHAAPPVPPAARVPDPSLRSLSGVSVKTADGGLVEVAGYVVDLAEARATTVLLRVEGAPRAVEWRRLQLDPEAGWRTDLTAEQLRRMPAVGVDGQAVPGVRG